MAEPGTPTPSSNGPQPAEAAPRTWRSLWQVPALIGAALLLAGGVFYAKATRPKPNIVADFRRAQEQIEERQYALAISTLNERVHPVLAAGGLTREQEQGFYLMRARALYLGQREAGIAREDNNRNIIAEYERALRLEAQLQPEDHIALAETLLALGELERAAKHATSLGDDKRAQRVELLQRLVELSLADKARHPLALELLGALTDDAGLSGPDRMWTLARQARLSLAQGYAEDAATRILRTLPRIMGQGDPRLQAEVLVTLARAYMAQNDMVGAGEQLAAAMRAVGELNPAAAEIFLLKGRVHQAQDRLEEARDSYERVIEAFAFSAWRAEAMLGLAEVEARLVMNDRSAGTMEVSLQAYETLVDSYFAAQPEDRPTLARERVAESLTARYREQFDLPDYRTALRFVNLAERLYGPEREPPDLLLALATVRRKLAEELLASDAGGLRRLSEVDPTTQREARALLLLAGEYFSRHANRVVQVDPRSYADSIWSAADSFDRAGDTREAIRSFQQFAADFPTDPRAPEARFRLGEAYRAEGDVRLAEQVFRDLLIDHDGSQAAGPYADASYVPLAQTLLSDESPENDEEAEKLLREVATGRIGGVGTQRYRDALRELGDYYYRTQRYELAIERLEEYLRRASDAPQSARNALLEPTRPLIMFKLADSYRLSARGIDRTLQGALPDSDERALRATRAERLARAAALFEQVTVQLEAKENRSAFEDLCLRNAYFYRGDVAFDTQDFDTAIRHYEVARERYPRDPATLVALTQIVSALLAQGEPQRAAVANQRAQKFYEALPESVWEDPTLPMGKREWERWLSAQGRLAELAITQAEQQNAEDQP